MLFILGHTGLISHVGSDHVSSDQEIDYSDLPKLDNHFLAKAKMVNHAKQPISLRIDLDMLDWFKYQDGRYQKLINYVLR